MYVLVWEFRVRAEGIQAFLKEYGSAGDWAKLFRRAEGYVGTELARSTKDPQVFYTLDTWKSKASYAEFRAVFSNEYEALDKSFEGLTEHERFIGAIGSE
jgi:quinol monooxygenase YgiN